MTDLLITGAAGFVGHNLLRLLGHRMSVVPTDWRAATPDGPNVPVATMDIRDAEQVRAVLGRFQPRAVIHAAGDKDVRHCQEHPEEAFRTNAEGTRNVARACRELGAHLLYVSTDLVFDCVQGGYGEDDTPKPTLVYGQTKRRGEEIALEECPGAAVCRSGGIYGRRSPLLGWLRRELEAGRRVEAFTDVFNTPTYVGSLADMFDVVVRGRLPGIFHTVGGERVSRYGFFRAFAEAFALDAALLVPEAAGPRRDQMLLQADASLCCRRTIAALGVAALSAADGLSRLRDEGGA